MGKAGVPDISGVNLGQLAEAYIVWMAGIVGPENVRMVTIIFIALLGISFVGLIFKTIKKIGTALILAVGLTAILGSFGVHTYTQFTPQAIEQVIDTLSDKLPNR